MKPSYITVNFQQTAAQRFPAQADELSAAFTARLQALRAENAIELTVPTALRETEFMVLIILLYSFFIGSFPP